MAFTSWSDLRTAIKDAIANQISGAPCVGEYWIKQRRLTYRTYDELIGLLEKTYQLEALETAGTVSTRKSFGRYRRFR